MELAAAVVLGLIEGLTEFIPVSSTGHLILAAKILHFEGAAAETFEIFIQLGAILAVVVLYFSRFTALLDFSFKKPPDEQGGFRGFQGLAKLAAGCLPAFVLGAALHKTIKLWLFGPVTVALALIIWGLVMAAVERRGIGPRVRALEQITYGQCFGIGLFQCLALWPGISRSGSTIVGGLLLGLERSLAAEFSFLLAVPVMCAAVIYDLLKSISFLTAADLPVFAAGFAVSFVTACLAIRFFMALLQRYTLTPFGVYRICLGLLVLALSLS